MTMSKLLPVIALALLAAPAFAQPPQSKAEAQDKDKQVCKRVSVTGSLVQVRRICGTRGEWEAKARAGREYGEGVQDAARVAPYIPRE
jgi:hypothetical protein